MDSAPTVSSARTDVDLRQGAKERLYVICQTGGWGFFLVFQVVFSLLFPNHEDHHDPVDTIALLVLMTALGLLLTHYLRPLMTHWGWKQLGWRPLVPRVLATSAVVSFLWSALNFGLAYGPMRIPWTSKHSPALILFVVWINLATLLVGWLCIYFFYHLFDRFNRSEIERLRLATNVKEAELRALKSQINPHFIFNSLNSLRGLIDENPDRARQAVTQLANLLRYSLQSGHLETVPFEDELRTVNDYLALEQVRHEERLRVRLDIAPGALSLAVPPMLLQTLVENAVKYGIAPRREGGEITVVARCERDHLRLQVTNPGTLAANGGSTGVGLRNAAERLQLLFGARATLGLREDPTGRVIAEVILPLEGTAKEWPPGEAGDTVGRAVERAAESAVGRPG
ncbi:MAG TPA: sensor histidine kinase [Opitutaceae bacterium]|nr:sensor histidine kinase [Opitutaceae bacterium]